MNMYEDARNHIYVQRPHSSHPHPPPILHAGTHSQFDKPIPLKFPLSVLSPPITKGSTILPKETPIPLLIPSNDIIETPKVKVASDLNAEDKSYWTARAMEEHVDVLEVIERVRSLNKAASFGRLHGAVQTATQHPPDDILGHDILLQLILQHLHTDGMKVSRKILEEESHVKYVDYQLSTSRLLTLMQLAIKDTSAEHVWVKSSPVTPRAIDINIWDEAPSGNIIYGDNNSYVEEVHVGKFYPQLLLAASLNQLVVALTTEKLCDLEYFKTFMWTYQSFTSPEKLLQKLIERYHVPRKGKTSEEWKQVSTPVQERVGKVLLTWLQSHWEDGDFSMAMVHSLKSFIDNDLRLDGNLALVKSLSTTINSKLCPADGHPDDLLVNATPANKNLSHTPSPSIPNNIYSPSMNVLDVDEEEIARQLTLVDYSIFSSIKATEFLNQAWNNPKLKQRSPNIVRALQHCRDITKWVSISILKTERAKDRALVMVKFMRIAECLMHLRNFNGAMAILDGLRAPSVERLKHTKEEIPPGALQAYNELQVAMSPSYSYKEYRAIFSRAVPPCIPYLGVALADLTVIEENNSDYVTGGLINFEKRRLISKIITTMKLYQGVPYNLERVYQITSHLWNPLHGRETTNEEEYRFSLAREPLHEDRTDII